MHSELHENSTIGYTEYSITLSRALMNDEWIKMDTFDYEFDNLMYPQTSWFYHQEKDISESIMIKYDVGRDVIPGYRDASNWGFPIKVRLYFVDDGFPEIMDRHFYLIHTLSAYIEDLGEIDNYFLAEMDFVMIDDDPQIEDSSLRLGLELPPDGREHVDGEKSGDEILEFTCFGCGTYFACFSVNLQTLLQKPLTLKLI